MIEVNELIEIFQSLGGKTRVNILCDEIGKLKKMPIENEHVAHIIKILEYNRDTFAFDDETYEWFLINSKQQIGIKKIPSKKVIGTDVKSKAYDPAVEYILSKFEMGRLSNNLNKDKKDMTQKFCYRGKMIGCVYYINKTKSNYASVEFIKDYFDKNKYDMSSYDFEDRTIKYNEYMPPNPNKFMYKIKFTDFEEVRDLIENACEDIIRNK